jgi:hypothetical protein
VAAARPSSLRSLVQFGRAIDAAVPLEVNGDWTMTVRDFLARLPAGFAARVIRYGGRPPYQVIFRPSRTSPPQAAADFREDLTKIPASSELYEAWIRYAADDEPIRAGAVVTSSEFIASEFGDRVLHCHHRRWGVD